MITFDFRLGIVQDGPVAFDGNNYWYHRPMGQYLKSLSQVFNKIDIYAPVIFKNNSAFHCWNEFKLDQRWACVHTLSVGGGNPVRAIMRQMRTFTLFYQWFQKNDFVLFFCQLHLRFLEFSLEDCKDFHMQYILRMIGMRLVPILFAGRV